MSPAMDRRRALTALGAAGLGSFLAAACGGDDDDSAPPTSGTTQPPSTTAGAAAADAAGLVGRFDAANSCAVTPEVMEGPYYLDLDLVRSDIREDRQGTPLLLGVRVLD